MKYSVALCTYNGEKYLAEQLHSIIAQTIQPSQIVISDDGSKDRTLAIAEEILSNSDIPYSIVENVLKHGVTSNFMNAMRLCEHPVIFTCDQDDIWVAQKAEKMLEVFAANSKALLVLSNGELVDKDAKSLNADVWGAVGIYDYMLQEQKWFDYLLERCLVTGAGMAIKKELLAGVEEIPECWLHDGWLALLAAIQEGIYTCNEKLFLYRQHGNNVVGMKQKKSLKKVLEYIRNTSVMLNVRKNRYERYSQMKLIHSSMLTEAQISKIDACILFWKGACQLQSGKKLEGIRWILENLRNGNYTRFFTGSRGAIRDLVGLFTIRKEGTK